MHIVLSEWKSMLKCGLFGLLYMFRGIPTIACCKANSGGGGEGEGEGWGIK